MIVIHILLIIFFSFILIKATEVLVSSIQILSRVTSIGKYAITGIILAIATSLPELFVGIVSSLEGYPNLSLGNVLGSNIADISIVVAIGVLIAGAIPAYGQALYKDLAYVFAISVSPLVLLIDKQLSRVDGLLLIVTYLFYTVVLLKRKKGEEKEGEWIRIFRKVTYSTVNHTWEWGKLLLGIFLVILSSDVIVKNGVAVAEGFGVPVLLIGLFMVAIGTSFPEIAFTIQALRKHEASIAYGDILGSIVANATLVLGITSLISPITITAFSEYITAVGVFLLLFFLFVFFIRTKHRIDRWEGAVLFAIYILFALLEFIF